MTVIWEFVWNFYLAVGQCVKFVFLAFFQQFSVVFLYPLLLSICVLSPTRTCAASNRKFKYFFKRVSCFRCQPNHFHHTSLACFAQTLEHQRCKSHFEQSKMGEKQGISFPSYVVPLIPCFLVVFCLSRKLRG